MEKGTQVIRRVDVQKSRPIYGTIDMLLPNNRCRVAWRTTQGGLVRVGNGRANKTEVSMSSLVEVTPAIRDAISKVSRERKEAYQKQYEAQRPYLCVNVNPSARVENDGHKTPISLLPSQVKDGRCLYCGAVVQQKEVLG